MRMVGGDEGGEKERSVREAEQPGDGEIFVEVWPVDPGPAADRPPAVAGIVGEDDYVAQRVGGALRLGGQF